VSNALTIGPGGRLLATNATLWVTNGNTLAVGGAGGQIALRKLNVASNATLSFTLARFIAGATKIDVSGGFQCSPDARLCVDAWLADAGTYTLVDYHGNRTGAEILPGNVIVDPASWCTVNQSDGGKITVTCNKPHGLMLRLQ
jgi:hypothetical protein